MLQSSAAALQVSGKLSATVFSVVKLLLQQRETVVYLCCSKKETNHYVQLIPSDDGVEADLLIFPESTKQTEIDALYDPDTYFIDEDKL